MLMLASLCLAYGRGGRIAAAQVGRRLPWPLHVASSTPVILSLDSAPLGSPEVQ